MAVGEVHAAGRIWLQMTGDVEHRWCLVEEDPAALELGEATLSVAHPAYGRVELPVNVTSSRGRGEIVSATLGSAAASLDRVLAHWVDVPAILPAEPLETPLASWRVGGPPWAAVGV